MNRYITLNSENVVVSVRTGKTIVEGEIQSDTGDLTQIMQEDGTFTTPTTAPIELEETTNEKIDRLELQVQQDNLVTFDVLATIYEELLMRG